MSPSIHHQNLEAPQSPPGAQLPGIIGHMGIDFLDI
jgi:hypothetical protein